MSRDKTEKLGSLFLAVFSTGLAAQLATHGMNSGQWLGAAAAVAGSIAMVVAVRVWPQPQVAEAPARRGPRD
jgi:glycerol uptake facilitator-like aquaporin